MIQGILISESSNGHAIHKVSLEEVRDSAAVLRALSPVVAAVVPLRKNQIYISDLAESSGLVVTALDHIMFNAHWYTKGSNESRLTIHAGDSNTHIACMPLKWVPNPEVVPVMCTTVGLSENGYQVVSLLDSHLFLVDRETGQTYTPPLPNVYADGRLCTGAIELDGTADLGVSNTVDYIIRQWSDNRWNRDLYKGWMRPFMDRQFSFDATTGEQNTKYMTDEPEWFKNLPLAGTVLGTSQQMQEVFPHAVHAVCQ